MHLELAEIAQATEGQLVAPERTPDVSALGRMAAERAWIDSRSVEPGDLFVPLVAERDGHDFVAAAAAAGATATLWSRGATPDSGLDIPRIVVEHTDRALADLGRYARSRFGGPLVGITGSVGKTSAKDMLRSVLATQFVVSASPRSHNNEIGVPLTLVNIADDAQAVVIEMGARAPGHIRYLCEMAVPTVGVVLCVAGAHLETFGSLDGVAKAKGELIDSLDETGVAILNSDDPLVAAMADRTEAEVLTFGSRGEVRAEELEVGADLRARFTLQTPHGSVAVRLAVPGVHQVSNALAAAASAVWLGVGPDGVAAGLEEVEMSPWRMELQRSDRGIVVLNDAYNANPTSTAAALRSFAQLDADRKVAVLGPMAELGPDGPQQHRQIAQLARELGLDVLAVGASDYAVSAAFGGDQAVSHVDTIEEALAQLGWLRDGDAVLVKGSRVAALERLAARLLEA